MTAVATAQDSTRPDPDSPAGVEYQLPLERAREDAAKGGVDEPSRKEADGSTGAPLFGAGVEPGQRSSDRPGAGGSARDGGTTPEGGETREGSGDESARRALAAEIAGGGGSGVGPTLLIVAAILVLGGLAGFGLRRLWQ